MLNEDVTKVVELYFVGYAVNEAINIVKKDSERRRKLEENLKELEQRKQGR